MTKHVHTTASADLSRTRAIQGTLPVECPVARRVCFFL